MGLSVNTPTLEKTVFVANAISGDTYKATVRNGNLELPTTVSRFLLFVKLN